MKKLIKFFKEFNEAICFMASPKTYFLSEYTELMQKHFECMQVLNQVSSYNKDCYIGVGSLLNKE